MRRTSERAPNRYRWTWPHAPEAINVAQTRASLGLNLVIYVAAVAVFALPWVERATGIDWPAAATVIGVHAGWVVMSAILIGRRALTSRRAFDVQVVGNVLLGTAVASAFPLLADAPASVLWGFLILYATMNGALAEFEPSITLQAFHVGVPLATIPLFHARGASDWWIAGPVITACMAAMGYHLTASQAAFTRRYRRAALDAERKAAELRLARDLHDVVGSTLGTVKAYADMLTTAAPSVALPLSDVAQHGLDDLRGVLDALAPPRGSGLASTVEAIARRIVVPPIDVEVTGEWPATVDGPVRVAVARIVQEALYNAVRHAKPTAIVVTCVSSSSELCVEVRDNGSGFVPKDGDGRGLAAMHARASELAGTLMITSDDNGTTITARFPLAMSKAA